MQDHREDDKIRRDPADSRRMTSTLPHYSVSVLGYAFRDYEASITLFDPIIQKKANIDYPLFIFQHCISIK